MTYEEANERMHFCYLRGIESAASQVAHYAWSVGSYARGLASIPHFEARAQEEMEHAETALLDALEKVREARRVYAEKPVDRPSYLEAAE